MFDFPQSQIMGILNVTPDSFSDGGHFIQPEKAVLQALRMVEEGAHLIDVGGESTRPGAQAVSVQQELDRVIPVIELLAQEVAIPVSIDTSKTEVMVAAVQAGASMVNDVNALSAAGALQACAELNVPVCMMHMQGEPRTMQQSPVYPDGVVNEINRFFSKRIESALKVGIARENICLDPGFGFGKTLQQNYEILANLQAFHIHERPLLIGVSRKSMIGNVLNVPVEKRLSGSLAAATIAAMKGAKIFRVHDVRETVEVLAIAQATLTAESSTH